MRNNLAGLDFGYSAYSYTYTGPKTIPANTEETLLKISGAGRIEYGIITFKNYSHNLRDLRFTINADDRKMELSIYEAYLSGTRSNIPYGFSVERFYEEFTWVNPNVSFSSVKGRFIYTVRIPSFRFNNSFELSVNNTYNDAIYINAFILYSKGPVSLVNFEPVVDEIKRVGDEMEVVANLLSRIVYEISRLKPEEIKEVTRELIKETERMELVKETERVKETPPKPEITKPEAEAVPETKAEEAPKKEEISIRKYLPLLAITAAAVMGKEEEGA